MHVLMRAGFTRAAAVAALAGLAACSEPPVNWSRETPPPVADSVDLTQYAGLWYEIARFPNSFEENCYATTAEYSPRPEGGLRVVNTCRRGSVDGEPDQAEGRARVVEGSNNAKLEVSFFGPFWGDYWILDVAEDYGWSLVGGPEGRYLWILARTPHLPDDVLQSRLETLRELGYDTEALYFTPQPEPPADEGAQGDPAETG